mgnify:FL=1
MVKAAKVYVLHENEEWYHPLKEALDQVGVPNEEWNISTGQIALDTSAPEGIYYSKMSASSYTRGHLQSKFLMAAILEWLVASGRRIINGKRALELEISKAAQHLALRQSGLNGPETFVALGKKEAIEASQRFDQLGFIVKPNQGGKGLGVHLFRSTQEFQDFLAATSLEELTVDGILLIQEYIPPKDQRIVRMEFIGGQFYYAVQVFTGGGFELCPADACELDPTQPGRIIPSFSILDNFYIPEIEQCEAFLAANHIEVAGMEFLENENGDRFFYDVNTNTNYNSEAEKSSLAGRKGIQAVALFLKKEWEKLQSAGIYSK